MVFYVCFAMLLPTKGFFLVDSEPGRELVAVRVVIRGMTCQSCVRSIEDSVRELAGIEDVKVGR